MNPGLLRPDPTSLTPLGENIAFHKTVVELDVGFCFLFFTVVTLRSLFSVFF